MAKVSAAVQDAADEIVLVIDNSGPLWHRKIEIIAKNVKCFSAPLTGNGCRARFASLVAAGVADAVRAAPDDKERNKALRTVTAQRLAANELRDSARAMIKSGEWAKHYAAKYGGGAALAGPVPRRGTKRAAAALKRSGRATSGLRGWTW